jgi:hypothetical protein
MLDNHIAIKETTGKHLFESISLESVFLVDRSTPVYHVTFWSTKGWLLKGQWSCKIIAGLYISTVSGTKPAQHSTSLRFVVMSPQCRGVIHQSGFGDAGINELPMLASVLKCSTYDWVQCILLYNRSSSSVTGSWVCSIMLIIFMVFSYLFEKWL